GHEPVLTTVHNNMLVQPFNALGLNVPQNDLVACPCQSACHFSTNATGCAGHSGDLATQVDHDVSFALAGRGAAPHFDTHASFGLSRYDAAHDDADHLRHVSWH